MAFAKVQIKQASAFSGTTVTITPAAPFTAGNALFIGFTAQPDNNHLTSVSGGGNTYNISTTTSSSVTGGCYGSAYALNIAAGSPSIVCTFSTTIVNNNVWVEEWSGVSLTSDAFDGGSVTAYSGGSGAAGQSITAGSFTPTTDGDLIWSFCVALQGTAINTGATWTSAFSTSVPAYQSEFKTQTTAAAINPDYTTNAGQFDLGALGAAFKAPIQVFPILFSFPEEPIIRTRIEITGY